MKKIYASLLVALAIAANVQAQVTVSGSTGADGSYPSLTKSGGAFAALNAAGSQSGNNVTISITADVTTEDGANGLSNGGWTSLTISPSGARILSGTVLGAMISLNGASKVTINGLNSGGNSLTLDNVSTNSAAITVRFQTDASNNTITNCTIKGAGTSTTLGTIVFGIGTTTGNDNNTISNCTITNSGSNLPTNAIYSAGLSASADNSGETISNNNIQDYFNAAAVSTGINVASNSASWTITGNKFFQSGARTMTTGAINRAILIVTASGGGYTISSNTIGYGSSTGTGTTQYSGSSNRFIGIDVTAAASPVSSIQGNTISGITISSSSGGSATAPVFGGIITQAGAFNIGTTTGNTIGATTGTGAISITGTTTGFFVDGIYSASTSTVAIANNKVGAINAAGATSVGCLFYGIWATGSGGSFTITSNVIGSTTTVNSIMIGTDLTGTASSTNQNFYGIRCDATGTTTVGSSGSGNTVQNIAVRSSSSAAFYGYYNGGAAASASYQYNTLTSISMGYSSGTVGTGAFYGMYNTSTITGTHTLSNNTLQNLTLNTTGSIYLFYNSSSTATVNAQNNTLNNIGRPSTATSGVLYCYYNGSSPTGLHTISGNTFTNITSGLTTGTTYFYGIYNLSSSSSSWNINNNTFSSITAGSGSSSTSYVIYDGYGGSASTCNNNTISGVSTAYILYGIYLGGSLTSTVTCSGNTINGLSSIGASNTVYGIYTTATTPSIFKNRIYDLQESGATGTAYGIYTGGGTTVSIYNNLVGDVRATASSLTAPAPSVAGLYFSSGTTINAHFNSIYLNASSSGTNFGTAGIYMTATPTTIKLLNNNVVNLSTPNGTGKTVAAQKSSTSYTNYSTSSASNNWYAGTPGASRLLFYDGTNGYQTIGSFKSAVTPREGGSVSENPSFLSTSGASASFLHINTAVATQLEGKGTPVAGVTDDYDGDTRNATTPDIGADEFNGIAADASGPTITYTQLSNTSSTASRTFAATITDASGVEVTTGQAPRVYYKRKSDANVFNDNSNATTGWKYVESTTGSSPFSFTLNYSLLNGGAVAAGDTIQYFVVAQDVLGNVDLNSGVFTSAPSSVDLQASAFPLTGTINSYAIVQAISGVKTVCASGCDYASLTNAGGAFATLNANEVTGNVTLQINANLSGETGANALNAFASPYTVTIKPNSGTTPTISGTVAGALMKLNGADRVTIDGSNTVGGTTRDMTITNANATSGSCVVNIASLGGAGNGANNNTIKNCNIVGGSATVATTYGIVSSASSSLTTAAEDNDNLTIQNNSVTTAYKGISCLTSSTAGLALDGLNISGNSIGSNTAANYVLFKGIEVSYATSPTIDGNTVFNMKSSISTSPAAIEIGAGVTNGSVSKNVITGIYNNNTSGWGAWGINFSSSTATSGVLVSNNMISDIQTVAYVVTSTLNAAGIRLVGGTNIKLYHNTVNLFGSVTGVYSSSTGGLSSDIMIGSSSVTAEIRDNILVNTQSFAEPSSRAYNVWLSSGLTSSVIAVSNSNDYYGASSTNTTYDVGGVYTSSYYPTLTDWKAFTSSDAASIAVAPIFTSNTDLHLQSVSGNGPLNNKGSWIASVLTDIDGDIRDNTYPDMGADEFTPPLGIDVGVTALVGPTAATCHTSATNANENVIVTVTNFSGATLDMSANPLTVTTNVSRAITAGPLSATVSNGLILPGQTLNVTVGQINTSTNGTYSFNSTATVTGDVDNTNDDTTISVAINYTPLTVTPTASPASICVSGTTTISAGASGGEPPYTYLWSTGATTASITTPTLTQSTTYSVQVSGACGVTASNSINILVNNPQVTGTTPGTNCGTGTVTLGASGSAGSTLNWYAASSGGTALGTGNTFTTPSINTTTAFYVSAVQGGTTANVGKTTPPGAAEYNTSGAYLKFDAFTNFTLNSVVVYPYASSSTAGTLVISLQNSAGTVLQQTAAISLTGTPTVTPLTVPLNFTVTPGTAYRLVYQSSTGITGLLRDASGAAGINFPYTLPGIVSITDGSLAGYYYYFYNWSVSTGCESARTPVIATVTNPTPITTSATLTAICAGGTSTLSTSSSNGNYSYSWAPGAVGGASITVTPGSTTTYTVTADDGNCTVTDSVTVTVQPSNPTVASSVPSICNSGTATLTANPSTGYGANTLQWQSSPDNVTFTDVSGQTNPTYTTPTLTSTTYYKLLVKNSAGTVCAQPAQTVTVYAPAITTTSPGAHCGPGTVVLGADASAGASIKWYDVATGGTPQGTGGTFTTPVLTATKTFYAAANQGGTTVNTARLTAPNGAGTNLSTYGEDFTVTESVILNSVDVISAGGTAITVSLYDATGNTQLQTTGSVAVTANATKTVNLGWSLAPGTYRLAANAMTGNFIRENSGPVYPIALGTFGQINGYVSSISGTVSTSASYYWFYNWSMTTGCESPRVSITATINTPPAITPSASGDNVCAGSAVTLNVTSPNSNYSYSWTPGNLSGATQTVNPTATTKYYVNANDATTQCTNIDSVTVNVQPNPTLSSSGQICVSGAATLTATPSSPYAANTLQWQSSTDNVNFTNISGATSATYTTPTLTSTTYYKLVVTNGAGATCFQPTITQVVNNPQIVSTTGASRCGPGAVTLHATASTGASINWYNSASGSSPVATGTSYTPTITGNTTFYAAASQGGSSGLSIPGDGAWNHFTTTGAFQTTSITSAYMVLTALTPITLQSMDIYPSQAVGTAFGIEARTGSASGTAFASYSGTTTVQNVTTPTVAQTVPVSWSLPAGTYYIGFTSNPGTWRSDAGSTTPGQSFPWTLSGVASMTFNLPSEYQYYFFNLKLATGCETPRVAVNATITTAPAITVGHTLDNICSGSSTNLSVTSSEKNYSYTWTPGTGITGTWVTVRPTVTTKYYVNASNPVTGCQNLDSVTINVQPTAILNATTISICSGSTATLTATPSPSTSAFAANSLQWQSSPNNSSWTNISGAISSSYTTPTLSSGGWYRLQVKNGTGGVCSQAIVRVNVSNPVLVSSTAGSRCGTGTVNLGATTNAGSAPVWYAASSGGTPLGQGTTFTTPSISATTTYYVAPATASAGETIGVSPTATTCGTIANSTASDWPLRFTTTKSALVLSAYVIPNAAGIYTFALRAAASSTNIQTATATFTAGQVGVPQQVALNFVVPAAGNYQITSTTANLYRISTFTCTYPYTNSSGSFSIVGSATSSTTAWTSNNTTTYNVFFSVQVADYCEGSRTPVIATVTTASAPSVSIAVTGGSNPTCSGAPVTFTATPTNGGTAPSYQWQKNGAIVGTNSNKYTDPGFTGGAITVVMTSNSTCVTTATATSNSITLSTTPNAWTGAVSTDFSNPANWCAGVVPSSAADVSIPAGVSNMPTLSRNVTVNNLTLTSGSSIDINGYQLTINGTLSGTGYIRGFTGYPTANDYVKKSTLIFAMSSGAIGTLYMDPSARGLGVMNFTGATTLALGNALDIYDSVDVNNATLTTNDNLSLKSVQSGTGRVGEIMGGDVTGNVTVERWVRNVSRKAWRLLSVPTQGSQTVKQAWQENQPALANGNPGYGTILTSTTGVAQGYDAVTTYNSLLMWDAASGSFQFAGPTSTPISNVGMGGYYVYLMGDRSVTPSSSTTTTTTLRTKGTLYKKTQSVLNLAAGENHVVGNIYPSAIDFTELQQTSTGLTAFSVWDPALASSSTATTTGGALQTFSAANGWQAVPGGGTYAINPVNTRIEEGQAFVVSPAGAASITFTENAKTIGSRQTMRMSDVIKRVKSNLLVVRGSNSYVIDGNVTVFDNSYEPGLDAYDVIKMQTSAENFGINNNGKVLVIDARPEITSTDVINFTLTNAQPQQQYVLEFTSENLNPELTAYLEDSYLRTQTPVALTTTQSVQFTVTNDAASYAKDRFKLVFKASGAMPVTFVGVKATANQSNKTVRVEWNVSAEKDIKAYEVEHSTDGRSFATRGTVLATANNTQAASYNWMHETPAAGKNYYRIKSVGMGGDVKYSSVVNVTLGSAAGSYVVAPNPVKDGNVNVQFVNQPEGRYTIRLYNQNGQVVYSRPVEHTGGSSSNRISLSSSLPGGVYKIEVVQPDKQHYVQSLIIDNGK